MATRSTISILTKDGVLHTVQNHFDGYLSYTGNILLRKYKSLGKIKKLINNGNVYLLEDNVNTTKTQIQQGITHTFENRVKNVTLFELRDCNEHNNYTLESTKATITTNLEKNHNGIVRIAKINIPNEQKYNYLFDESLNLWLYKINDYMNDSNWYILKKVHA